MLKFLSIRNVVLIDSLDIDFSKGLTVFSGETGAGKSILLDSLGLILGNRSETSLIRVGADKLTVTGVFEIDASNKIYDIAKEYDLEIDGDIIIKRTITQDGKNKVLFNDQVITLKLLKEISSNLIEIHGQHDNQGLLNPSFHENILDSYGCYSKELDNVKISYDKYKKSLKKLKEKEELIKKAKEDEENIKHWVKELDKISPQKDEEDILRSKRQELMNAEKIIEKLNYAYSNLNGAISVAEQLSKALNSISKVNELVDGKYSSLEENIENTLYTINDIIDEIENISSSISLSQNEIDNIETRLFALKDLARKHQTTINDLPNKKEEFENILNNLQNDVDNLENLYKEVEENKKEYTKSALILSDMRKSKAEALDTNINKELPPLKMEKALFKTSITIKEKDCWSDTGCDNVCFEVSTNPNTPLGALNKIASGGELSRLMLALKVNLAQQSSQETLIFDEIDTGIGGATAQAVGERLSRLSKNLQILVVTHSPQVASFGSSHFKVEKQTKDNITTTNLIKLDENGKLEEVARMLSGETITKEARAAAKVLLNKETMDSLF